MMSAFFQDSMSILRADGDALAQAVITSSGFDASSGKPFPKGFAEVASSGPSFPVEEAGLESHVADTFVDNATRPANSSLINTPILPHDAPELIPNMIRHTNQIPPEEESKYLLDLLMDLDEQADPAQQELIQKDLNQQSKPPQRVMPNPFAAYRELQLETSSSIPLDNKVVAAAAAAAALAAAALTKAEEEQQQHPFNNHPWLRHQASAQQLRMHHSANWLDECSRSSHHSRMDGGDQTSPSDRPIKPNQQLSPHQGSTSKTRPETKISPQGEPRSPTRSRSPAHQTARYPFPFPPPMFNPYTGMPLRMNSFPRIQAGHPNPVHFQQPSRFSKSVQQLRSSGGECPSAAAAGTRGACNPLEDSFQLEPPAAASFSGGSGSTLAGSAPVGPQRRCSRSSVSSRSALPAGGRPRVTRSQEVMAPMDHGEVEGYPQSFHTAPAHPYPFTAMAAYPQSLIHNAGLRAAQQARNSFSPQEYSEPEPLPFMSTGPPTGHPFPLQGPHPPVPGSPPRRSSESTHAAHVVLLPKQYRLQAPRVPELEPEAVPLPCLPAIPVLVINEEVASLPDPHAPPTRTEAPAFIDPDKPEEGWMAASMCYSCFARDAHPLPLSGMLVEQLTLDMDKLDANLLEAMSGMQAPSPVPASSPQLSGSLQCNTGPSVSSFSEGNSKMLGHMPPPSEAPTEDETKQLAYAAAVAAAAQTNSERSSKGDAETLITTLPQNGSCSSSGSGLSRSRELDPAELQHMMSPSKKRQHHDPRSRDLMPDTFLQAGPSAAGGLGQDEGQVRLHLFTGIGADLDVMMSDRGYDAVTVVTAVRSFEEAPSVRRKTSDSLGDLDPLINTLNSPLGYVHV
ncbi:hypothetical protein CEUSTIGMA_g10905.t1 [Chlamydomonas eustigma]|uniref:Uncharacterized protein n=1 Tax=Chlamydomonas eustigma TaxID=1157962 RepID=A0A250XL16_9CHLO|nr:hypothetical protein CEUSTIGMA_g10905.t1 [Chlamydomonas eustigma]|eukprot:GAX83480.1 hypothetical protein CEUSTIGMA_g10905.t1 [Chlamydomonas eustigma]